MWVRCVGAFCFGGWFIAVGFVFCVIRVMFCEFRCAGSLVVFFMLILHRLSGLGGLVLYTLLL